MIDQHVHTNYSPDSVAKIEDYIKKSKQDFYTFTDHYDLTDPWNNFADVTFDIEAQRKEMNELEKVYNVTIYQGIEIGYSRRSKERIRKVLNDNHFDVVLLSVHHNDTLDYMERFPNMTHLEVAEDYLNKVLEALNEELDADVLTHLDFGLRPLNLTMIELKSFEPTFEKILKKIISNKMSLEVNAKGIIRYNTEPILEYLIHLYHSLGGEDLVVNSDAHKSLFYRAYFYEIKEFLQSLGVKKLNYYIDRKKHSFKI